MGKKKVLVKVSDQLGYLWYGVPRVDGSLGLWSW